MRTAILCVFFALAIQKEGRIAADDGFRPMPIPLTEWHYDRRSGRVGTLHEAVNTDALSTVAAVPAHYWEDALRHSVYLTLVRDKIDQLIHKGAVISPNSEHEYASKETDDLDLWDKIKNAPFDRIKDEDHTAFGDVTIMSKGRLIEHKEGFRFTEDEKSKEKCEDKSCMKGVKAFWSVKRVRQRDEETSPGKYHYELTFSVMSQAPKKVIKPYDNPVRTFTVRENPPNVITEAPQQKKYFHDMPVPLQHSGSSRPSRGIWFHKNLVPIQSQARRYHQGLDRIFSTLFGDDDSPPEPPRYRPNLYPYPQHGKPGYMGVPNDQSQQHQQQKKLMAYPYKPPTYKYVRTPLQAPPLSHNHQHHYVDQEPNVGNAFSPQTPDNRYISPSNIVKTTRPAVLPTPPEPFLVTSTKTFTYNITKDHNITESTTKQPEVSTSHKIYSKQPKPSSVKVSYFPDHLRPPVYNAPPGVFVTMDKKPFKPMPPLKLVHSKPHMKHRPIDFRPSPQLVDMQYSDPSVPVDNLGDSVFRPIFHNLKENANKTSNNSKKPFRKPATNKKPQKKHENIKAQRVTTSAPDIITAVNIDSEDEAPEWANIVSAFTKTTPMEPQKEIGPSTPSAEDIIGLMTSTAASSTISTKKKRVTSTTTTEESTTTSTTPKPTKRTRPPPKFSKPDKIKKHKRITSTTEKPAEKSSSKTASTDLTPQASSAATRPNPTWSSKNKTASTISTDDALPELSTRPSTTTTTKKVSTTFTTKGTTTKPPPKETPVPQTTPEPVVETTQPKNKNRFRQSTLMQKGTSVNHDKWSVNNSSEKTKTVWPASGKFNPRRKGSNFQGHATTSKPKLDIDHKEEDHTDKNNYKVNAQMLYMKPTQPSYEDTADQYESNSEHPASNIENDNEQNYENNDFVKDNIDSDVDESDDKKEYIFNVTSMTSNEHTNEIHELDDILVRQQRVEHELHTVPKNKTKCKKKKHNNLTTSHESLNEMTSAATTTTTKASEDVLDELLGAFTYDDTTEKLGGSQTPSLVELDEEESENHEKYVQVEENFQDFLDVLDKEENHDSGSLDVDQYEDDDGDKEPSHGEDFSPFDNDSEDESPRKADEETYDDYNDRSLSFLELMAME